MSVRVAQSCAEHELVRAGHAWCRLMGRQLLRRVDRPGMFDNCDYLDVSHGRNPNKGVSSSGSRAGAADVRGGPRRAGDGAAAILRIVEQLGITLSRPRIDGGSQLPRRMRVMGTRGLPGPEVPTARSRDQGPGRARRSDDAGLPRCSLHAVDEGGPSAGRKGRLALSGSRPGPRCW